MSRKFVIFICCLNALLGVALLWLVFKPGKSSEGSAVHYRAAKTEGPKYTDEQLWKKAEEASSGREVFSYLMQISATGDALDQSARQLTAFFEAEPPDFGQWPYLEGLIPFHGNRAESLVDLQPLKQIALQPEQALTLREVASRSYIENFCRLNPPQATEAYALVDALYEEKNSLLATALRAERYLREQAIVRESGDELLFQRARATLLDSAALESNRLAAANLLLWLGESPEPEAIRGAWNSSHSERLKVKLLQIFGASARSDEDRTWLQHLRATTPEVERLAQSILKK